MKKFLRKLAGLATVASGILLMGWAVRNSPAFLGWLGMFEEHPAAFVFGFVLLVAGIAICVEGVVFND